MKAILIGSTTIYNSDYVMSVSVIEKVWIC